MNPLPKSIESILERDARNNPPHARKKLELACLIRATSREMLARELEELAQTIRREPGSVGTVSNGAGYYMTMTCAVTERETTP